MVSILKKGYYLKCAYCNKSFYVYPSEKKSRGRERKFCSPKCSNISQIGKPAWNKGIPHTKKHKEKLRKAKEKEIERPWTKTGKYVPCQTCGKLTYKCKAHLRILKKYYCASPCLGVNKRICSNEEAINSFIDGRLTLKAISEKYHIDRKSLKKILKGGGVTYNQIRTRANKIIGANTKKHRKYQVFPSKDTSIEIKMQKMLEELNIKYETHKYINIKHGYQCDIIIPKLNLIIECDGDYWHKRPMGREIDVIRSEELRAKGYKLLRFWESEIKVMDKNDLFYKLNKVFNL